MDIIIRALKSMHLSYSINASGQVVFNGRVVRSVEHLGAIMFEVWAV